jgi:hypothetical protein
VATQLEEKTWNALLKKPEVNRQHTPFLAFDWLRPVPADHAEALKWWKDRLDQARRQSNLKDLGPDLSLVGPGDAYLRGLKQEGREVPPEKLKPEPAPGGAVVVIRGGKDFKGFTTLKDAFQAARDGDVIELRASANLTGAIVPGGRGALTLRAGPGYQPTIESELRVHGGTALALEGLTFSSTASLWAGVNGDSFVAKGRITRLAYCFFKTGTLPGNRSWFKAEFPNKADAPAEIFRCVVQWHTYLNQPENHTLRIRESILSPTALVGHEDKGNLGSVELDACIVTAWDVHDSSALLEVGVNFWLGGKSRWSARRCLFESNQNLFSSLVDTKQEATWKGEKNYYRLSGDYSRSPLASSLAQWRALTGSKEAGSVEGEAPIAQPRFWRLRPGSKGSGCGPDVAKVACRAPLAKK